MKNKKTLIIVSIISFIIMILLISFILYNKYNFKLKKTKFYFEYKEELIRKDKAYYLEEDKKSVSIDFKDLKFDEYMEVNTYKVLAKSKFKKAEFEIIIRDTIKPKLINDPNPLIVEKDAEGINLKDYFKVEDHSDFKLEIRGKYDLKKIGDYKLKLKAIDKYNNLLEKDFLLKVVSMEDAIKKGVSKDIKGNIKKSKKRINYEKKKNNNKKPKKSNNKNTNGRKVNIENDIFNRTNSYRKKNGLKALKKSSTLQDIANIRVKELTKDFSHKKALTAENIGAGVIGYHDIFKMWIDSTGHRNNILGSYEYLAVGAYKYGDFMYYVQVFK